LGQDLVETVYRKSTYSRSGQTSFIRSRGLKENARGPGGPGEQNKHRRSEARQPSPHSAMIVKPADGKPTIVAKRDMGGKRMRKQADQIA